MNIGIIYGSNQGNTHAVSEKVSEKLGASLFNISDLEPEQVENLDFLIFASSTWGVGDLCDDWEMGLDKLDAINLEKKVISFIGLGDQMVYGSTFCDALRLIYDKIQARKLNHVGLWETESYEYDESQSIVDGKFMGLIIDEDNEPELTDERIDKWVKQVQDEVTLN
tara:strand:- start:4449 stop:4949 length:501 start_codon:yes stop_codon:yes gene_type:complete